MMRVYLDFSDKRIIKEINNDMLKVIVYDGLFFKFFEEVVL